MRFSTFVVASVALLLSLSVVTNSRVGLAAPLDVWHDVSSATVGRAPERIGPAAPLDVRDEVIALVNAEREKVALPSLTYSPVLAASAADYAAFMARDGFFGHRGPDGSTLVTRNVAAGYKPWRWLGENLAAGQSTASEVVSAWMASPSHRANILSPSAREIGVGFVIGGYYRYYWAQEFGARPAAQYERARM